MCEIEIIDCIQVIRSMCINGEKKQHMKVKGSDAGKGMKKWRKILVIAEVKISLSRDAKS